MSLRPFWCYYGGKWRAAPRYPKPRYRTIVEPFAGAAGYSLRYPDHDVVLVEKYSVIAEMWRYLIAVKPSEVLAIPEVEHVDDLPSWVPAGARALVGFNLAQGAMAPRSKASPITLAHRRNQPTHARGWGSKMRARVAEQVEYIRHWRVIEGSYDLAPDVEATWFVDPPYQVAGKGYVHGADALDFAALGAWCQKRAGQIIVCENACATWLPFVSLYETRTAMHGGANTEAVWLSDIRDLCAL